MFLSLNFAFRKKLWHFSLALAVRLTFLLLCILTITMIVKDAFNLSNLFLNLKTLFYSRLCNRLPGPTYGIANQGLHIEQASP